MTARHLGRGPRLYTQILDLRSPSWSPSWPPSWSRSDLMTVAVGFNPRFAASHDESRRGATPETWLPFGTRPHQASRRDATRHSYHPWNRGLKPTATFRGRSATGELNTKRGITFPGFVYKDQGAAQGWYGMGRRPGNMQAPRQIPRRSSWNLSRLRGVSG